MQAPALCAHVLSRLPGRPCQTEQHDCLPDLPGRNHCEQRWCVRSVFCCVCAYSLSLFSALKPNFALEQMLSVFPGPGAAAVACVECAAKSTVHCVDCKVQTMFLVACLPSCDVLARFLCHLRRESTRHDQSVQRAQARPHGRQAQPSADVR